MRNPDSQNTDAPLADYRQYYGLSRDPFQDDPEFPFYTGAGRGALLEQLRHLCQFSASMLAVLAPPGTGKTRLARELANSFPGGDDVCFIDAAHQEGAADLLGQLAQCFALPCDDSPSVGQLLAALRHFAQHPDEQDRLALTLIDNAQHLDEQTLGALTSLLQGPEAAGRRLHIVLFAEPEMLTRLDQFNMHDVLIHDFELAPLTLEEASDYLNFRMEMAGYLGPELFDPEQIEALWHRADGRLGALHRETRLWLLESVAPAPASGSGRPPLPLAHIVVVALLLGFLLMMLLYRNGDDSDQQADSPETADDEQLVEAPQRQPLDLSKPGQDGQEEPPAPDSQESPSRQELDQEMESRQGDDQPDPLALPSPLQEPTQEPEADSEPVPQAEEVQSDSPQPREISPEPESSHKPELPEDERILLSWNASDYTLQLLGASSRQSVLDYIERQPNKDRLLSFESRRQGKPWFVVVFGRYASSNAARAAIEQLPSAQRQAGPWPRDLGAIQEEIEDNRGL